MTIEDRLAAAERRIADLERRIGPVPVVPVPPFRDIGIPISGGCSCPPGSACGNVACPRRLPPAGWSALENVR